MIVVRSPVFFTRDKVSPAAPTPPQTRECVPSSQTKLVTPAPRVGQSKPMDTLQLSPVTGSSKSRAATLLLMKSLDHQSTSLSSSVSSQSPANSGSAGTSFNKFSRSNGYYSQVLRVSWNIIGMRGWGNEGWGNYESVKQEKWGYSRETSNTSELRLKLGITRLSVKIKDIITHQYSSYSVWVCSSIINLIRSQKYNIPWET